MSHVNSTSVFPLKEAAAAFLQHFGIKLKSTPTIRRYCRGVRVPGSRKKIFLQVQILPGGARGISLDMWNNFLLELQAEYEACYYKKFRDGQQNSSKDGE